MSDLAVMDGQDSQGRFGSCGSSMHRGFDRLCGGDMDRGFAHGFFALAVDLGEAALQRLVEASALVIVQPDLGIEIGGADIECDAVQPGNQVVLS